MSDALVALHLKSLRDAGFEWEASFFEERLAGLDRRNEHARQDARIARAEAQQWQNRCLDLKRRYGVRSADQPREHNEHLTYAYEGNGGTP